MQFKVNPKSVGDIRPDENVENVENDFLYRGHPRLRLDVLVNFHSQSQEEYQEAEKTNPEPGAEMAMDRSMEKATHGKGQGGLGENAFSGTIVRY